MSEIMLGITSVLSPSILILMFMGVVMGIIVGAIPGLTVTMGVALFLPMTYGMEPIAGLALLCALYVGGTSGGLISAILLQIPGTPASVATCFDGHPMAARGEAGKALGVGIVASFLGGFVSFIVLAVLAPSIARVALKFGAYEYFAIGIFSLIMIARLSRGSLVKGLISSFIRFAASFVGIAPVTSFARFTFGISKLRTGFQLLPALIGLFAVAQIMSAFEDKYKEEDTSVREYKIKGFGFTREDMRGQWKNFLVSTAIGTGVGILPGLGAGICNIMAYSACKDMSRYPEKFGTGIVDGIIASEASNNACCGGALVPLMTLGIPGDNTTAIILAGFMVHGIAPGPLLFDNQAPLVYGIFTALFISNIFMIVAEYVGMRAFVRILSVPNNLLMPIITVFCFVGAFGVNNRVFEIYVMLGFGLLGYVMKKLGIPQAPIILGFILGPIIELYLRSGLQRSHGSFMPFLTAPISGFFLALTAVVLCITVYREIRKVKKNKTA
jgi:putative tricarboxylic transport membrane protein